MLPDCKTLDDYLIGYGHLLGEKATRALNPLHVPGRDPVHPAIAGLLRRPIRGQKIGQDDVMTAIVKTWHRQKSVILAAMMGTGKTLMSAGACHIHARNQPYRAIVMCPDHLIGKWIREIQSTVPGAVATKFDNWRNVLAMAQAHAPPTAAQWYILGRDQSKFEPKWIPRFATRLRLVGEPGATRNLREKGATLAEVTVAVAVCPKCGTPVTDKDGNPIAATKIKTTARLQCQGVTHRHVREGDNVRLVEQECGEPLWQYTSQPYRWAPAKIIHSRMRRWFDYLVIDEAHEEKSAHSAQANAAGKLAASARKVIALTGTLIGGYAEHLFPLMHRIAPNSLVADNYGWGEFTRFNSRYGRIETTIHARSGKSRDDDDDRNSQSMGSSTRVTKRCRPGVMPQLFGEHLIDKAAFLSLNEVAESLPPLSEEIIPVVMDPELASSYAELEDDLRGAIKSMLQRGDKRMLGTMLNALLSYPDHPFGWETLGYKDHGVYIPICNVPNLDPDPIRAKEEALIALAAREKSQGRKLWVYIQMTQIKDVGDRLVRRLADAGITAGYMRSSVDRRQREAWIYKHAPSLDVMLSHPKLVETGLDLFATDGNHNFPTITFFQTGYNLFTIRQSSRRSWRIGQPLPCRTVFLYYAGTMQERAMALMGRKMAAAEAIEGKFSGEGLAAMGGEDDATLALARALADRVTAPAERAWASTLGFAAPTAVVAPPPAPVPTPTVTAAFSREDMEVFKRLFGRLKGQIA